MSVQRTNKIISIAGMLLALAGIIAVIFFWIRKRNKPVEPVVERLEDLSNLPIEPKVEIIPVSSLSEKIIASSPSLDQPMDIVDHQVKYADETLLDSGYLKPQDSLLDYKQDVLIRTLQKD